jgi:hypothetical protein
LQEKVEKIEKEMPYEWYSLGAATLIGALVFICRKMSGKDQGENQI